MNFRRGTAAKKIELVSAEEACAMVQEFFQSKATISIKTIYNKVWAKELKRYGQYKNLLLDKDEVIQKLCRHHGT